jgi:hypothetical protein
MQISNLELMFIAHSHRTVVRPTVKYRFGICGAAAAGRLNAPMYVSVERDAAESTQDD